LAGDRRELAGDRGVFKDKPTPDRSDRTPITFPDPRETKLFGRWLWRWDVRTGTRLSSIRWLASRAIRFLWFGLLWAPLVRGIVLECYSLPRRIGTIYRTKIYLRGVSFWNPEKQQDSMSRKQIFACIRDTQHITSQHGWATILDFALLAEAWQMGAEWGLSCDGTQQKDNISTPKLPAELLETSREHPMPPQEVQQDSKCDL